MGQAAAGRRLCIVYMDNLGPKCRWARRADLVAPFETTPIGQALFAAWRERERAVFWDLGVGCKMQRARSRAPRSAGRDLGAGSAVTILSGSGRPRPRAERTLSDNNNIPAAGRLPFGRMRRPR